MHICLKRQKQQSETEKLCESRIQGLKVRTGLTLEDLSKEISHLQY